MLRASDGDGWVLVAGNAEGRAELIHAGARAPSPSTPVVLASSLKWLTAAVVLSVVDEHRLALTDTPRRWLGDGFVAGASDSRGDVTLAHLLSMTSGLHFLVEADCDWLSCGRGLDAFTAVDSLAPFSRCVLEWAATNANAFGQGPPGAVMNYNTLSMQIAAAMAERAANASFSQLFSQTVQRRLAAAARYVAAPPQGLAVLMSPLDYATFMRAVLVPRERGGLLDESTRALMFSPTSAQMNGTLEFLTGAAGWRYGSGVWLEDGGEVASCLGFYGFYPRANLSSGDFAVLVPARNLLHDDAVAAVGPGMLMRRAVTVMRSIWAPLQRALAEVEESSGAAPSAAPAPAASVGASSDADECAEADTADDDGSDAVLVAQQAQRALFACAGAACSALLAARVRIHVTVHAIFSEFVRSKPAVFTCSNRTAAVRTHVYIDNLLADVPPTPPETSSVAFVAGAASSPRLWIKLKRAADVAVSTGQKKSACSVDLIDVASDEKRCHRSGHPVWRCRHAPCICSGQRRRDCPCCRACVAGRGRSGDAGQCLAPSGAQPEPERGTGCRARGRSRQHAPQGALARSDAAPRANGRLTMYVSFSRLQ